MDELQNREYTFLKRELFHQKSLSVALDSSINFRFENSNKINVDKVNYNYNSNGDISLISDFTWDSSTSNWVSSNTYSNKIEYYYLSNNDFGFTSYVDNQPLYKKEFFHDSVGNLIFYTNLDWNETTNSWVNQYRTTVNYTNNYETNRITENFFQQTNTWQNLSRAERIMNDSLVSEIHHTFWDINQWKNFSKSVFTYDSLNRVNGYKKYYSNSNQWLLSENYTFQHDSLNRLKLMYYYSVDDFPQFVQDYSYDSIGNLILLTRNYFFSNVLVEKKYFYDYNVDTSILAVPEVVITEESTKYFPSYDIQFFIGFPNFNSPMFYQYKNNSKIDSCIIVRYENGLETERNLFLYFYSQRDLGLNSPQENRPNIFPNPTTNFINIEESSKFESFELIDIKGELILKDKLNSSQIDISSLQNGIYFLNLINENKQISRSKIIKE